MTNPKDLTRWNRAGLSRFRYVDGNAATYLEDLRAALAEKFPKWKALQTVAGEKGEISNNAEADSDKLVRLMRQYDWDSGEWGWELARALARAVHVLTEHMDAFANEGYLRTATQWESVRRLVSMLDYHPAPPASATTRLVLHAKPGAAGIIEKGFAVKYTPPDGGPQIIFETLEDIEVNADANALRPVDHDRNQDPIAGTALHLAGQVKGLKSGQPLVLEDERNGRLAAFLIQSVRETDDRTVVKIEPEISDSKETAVFLKGYTRVHAVPAEMVSPVGPIPEFVRIAKDLRLAESPLGLRPREIVYITDAWYVTDRKNSYYRRVRRVSGKRLELSEDLGELRVAQATVARPNVLPLIVPSEFNGDPKVDTPYAQEYLAAGDWTRLQGHLVAVAPLPVESNGDEDSSLGTCLVARATYWPVTGQEQQPPIHEGYTHLNLLSVVPSNQRTFVALLIPPDTGGTWPVDTYIKRSAGLDNGDPALPRNVETAQTKKATGGDLAVIQSGDHLAWTRLRAVKLNTENETAEMSAESGWQERGDGEFYLSETTVYSHFEQQDLRLVEWQVNSEPLEGDTLPCAAEPGTLRPGQKVLVERADDPDVTLVATVIDAERSQVQLDRALSDGFTYGNTLISGNLVPAGHGQRGEPKVLGQGDATRSHQNFVLDQTNISFVADPRQATGVRADIDVMVDGRTWEQVSSLNDSGPADPHYTVRMTEEGLVKVSFGDGVRGRRLPTAEVRIAYRTGSGLEGNLPSGRLEKPLAPHPLIESVRQPLPAGGGNDMEAAESLRQQAPASLLTLQRAVSLNDFASLAVSQSSVWQARAFHSPTAGGRRREVEVVVVPAGGGELGELEVPLQQFLQAHAVPGVRVQVSNYDQIALGIDAAIFVRSREFNAEDVSDAVRRALAKTFSISARRLGQPVYLSEVYQVVESVRGVENSQCQFTIDRASKGPSQRELVYVPADRVSELIRVTWEEYVP